MKNILVPTLLTLYSLPVLAQQPPMPTPAQMSDIFIQQLDTDKDGKVSEAEYLQPNRGQFQHMDKNGDGNLDKAEVQAFASEMQSKRQQMMQQPKR